MKTFSEYLTESDNTHDLNGKFLVGINRNSAVTDHVIFYKVLRVNSSGTLRLARVETERTKDDDGNTVYIPSERIKIDASGKKVEFTKRTLGGRVDFKTFLAFPWNGKPVKY